LIQVCGTVTPIEHIATPPASVRIVHFRPRDGEPVRWLAPEVPDLESVDVLSDEIVTNVITTAGRDFLITQSYGTSPAANGLNYIGLSDDAVTETAASTTLSNEITANGLARAQGSVAHTTGANLVQVSKLFTCSTANQSAQKLALFTASSAGTMSHVVGFAERLVLVGTTLSITASITVG
jgi:hypothetical protein